MKNSDVSRHCRVFVSSTSQDLREERSALEKALAQMRETEFSGMEYFGSRPNCPKDVCMEEVRRSEVYIGIFANRYGFVEPESGLSMTELEYRQALASGLPCLIYMIDESLPITDGEMDGGREKLAALKEELKREYIVTFFSSPDRLATRVVIDLHNYLAKKSAAARFDEKEVFTILWDSFDLEEFRELCFFHLNVKYDDLRGKELRGKILDLVDTFDRNENLSQLVKAIQAAQPDLPLIPLNDEHHVGQRTRQVFTLFISAAQPARLRGLLGQIPVLSRLVEPSVRAASGSLPAVAWDRGENAPLKMIVKTHDDGVSIATFEEPEALLRQAVAIASTMKERGEVAPRIGLYSDKVSVSPAVGGDEVPAEAVNLARRIMKLGDAGHILASRQVAEYFNDLPEFAGLFKSLGKYEVRPHVRVEVFNFTSGAKFGNPTPPKRKEPEQVLRKFVIPKQIRGSQTAQIKLTFDESLPFVRVVFKYENPDIRITCPGQDGGDDCTFHFDFHAYDSRTQNFEIGAKGIKEHSQEVLGIYCYDEGGELLSPAVQARINLMPRVGPVVRLFLWLWDHFTGFRLYLRVLIAIVLLVLCVILLLPVLPTKWQDTLLITINWWPDKDDQWEDAFPLEDDGSPKVQADKWYFRGPNVQFPTIPPINPAFATEKDGALVISGEGIAVHQQSKKFAFYDFNLELRFQLIKGNTARWILRADPDSDCWYEFECQIDSANSLVFRGFVHTPRGLTELSGSGSRIDLSDSYRPGDDIKVKAQVEGYEFRYCASLGRWIPIPGLRRRLNVDSPIITMADRRLYTFFRGFRYGNAGLLSKADSEVLFHYWRVAPLSNVGFCMFGH